mgnify:CR=1 FL=1|jgi:integrase/recombinase XerD
MVLKLKQDKLWERYIDHLLNVGVSDQRIKKLKHMFLLAERGLGNNFSKITRPNVEKFVNSLHRNKFVRLDGKRYSGSAKSDVKKFLKQFFKWLHGENEYYPKSVSWLKTNIRKDERPEEKPTLDIKEVIQFANSFKKIELKLMVLLLFDSGFRIQEMLSVKKKDLTWEDFHDGEKCFWLNCNASKTLCRKVPIPLFSEDIQSFFNSSHFKSLEKEEYVFTNSYASINNAFRRNSEKLFKKRVSPHALRHSSATYYAKEYDGNMNLIAERYGWAYSSKELKTYIRRSGAYQRAGAKKSFENELVKLRGENKSLQKQINELAEKIHLKDSVVNTAIGKGLALNKDVVKEIVKQMVKAGEIKL